jgi:hypothetical protein
VLNPQGTHFSLTPSPSFPLRIYDQAALNAAVAAARAEERRQFVALCERAVRDFVNPGSELPYDHGFVSACNVLKQAAIRAATPKEPTAVMARPDTAEASERDQWQTAVFTLMGHAAGLYAEGKHDMPAWCYELAETIARTHLDEAHAQRVRQVAVQQRAMYGEPT